jgi:hypothetical protein
LFAYAYREAVSLVLAESLPWSLYDKISRGDILAHAPARRRHAAGLRAALDYVRQGDVLIVGSSTDPWRRLLLPHRGD